jgi:hypothetical protein
LKFRQKGLRVFSGGGYLSAFFTVSHKTKVIKQLKKFLRIMSTVYLIISNHPVVNQFEKYEKVHVTDCCGIFLQAKHKFDQPGKTPPWAGTAGTNFWNVSETLLCNG